MIQGIQDLTRERWLSELKRGTSIIQIAVVLFEDGMEVGLGNPFIDGMCDYAKYLLDEKPPELRNRIAETKEILLKLIPEDRITVLSARILDLAINQQGQLNKPFLELFGTLLGDKKTLKSRGDVITLLFDRILQKLDSTQMKWLERLFATEQQLIFELGTEGGDSPLLSS